MQLMIITSKVEHQIILLSVLKKNNDSFNKSSVWLSINGADIIFFVFALPNKAHIMQYGKNPTHRNVGISIKLAIFNFSSVIKTEKTNINRTNKITKKYLNLLLLTAFLTFSFIQAVFQSPGKETGKWRNRAPAPGGYAVLSGSTRSFHLFHYVKNPSPLIIPA
jgi:hypothetical protein